MPDIKYITEPTALNQPIIDQHIESLEKTIYDLRDRVAVLWQRVTPIVPPQAPSVSPEMAPAPMRSPIADRIANIDSTAAACAVSLGNLTAALEI